MDEHLAINVIDDPEEKLEELSSELFFYKNLPSGNAVAECCTSDNKRYSFLLDHESKILHASWVYRPIVL